MKIHGIDESESMFYIDTEDGYYLQRKHPAAATETMSQEEKIICTLCADIIQLHANKTA